MEVRRTPVSIVRSVRSAETYGNSQLPNKRNDDIKGGRHVTMTADYGPVSETRNGKNCLRKKIKLVRFPRLGKKKENRVRIYLNNLMSYTYSLIKVKKILL